MTATGVRQWRSGEEIVNVLSHGLGPVGARGSVASTLAYLVMGWLVMVAIQPVAQRMAWEGLLWLVAGGLL